MRRTGVSNGVRWVFLCVVLGAAFDSLGQTRYTVSEVTTTGLAGMDFRGTALNAAGGVAGYYLFTGNPSAVDSFKLRGFVSDASGVVSDLPVLGCSVDLVPNSACGTRASGINLNNEVVGETWMTGIIAPQAFVWREGVMTPLLPGVNFSVAHDINDDGFIVGQYQPPVSESHGFLHHVDHAGDVSVIINLSSASTGTTPALTSVAYAINNQNDIVGQSESGDGTRHATRWRFAGLQATSSISATEVEVTDLGVLPGGESSEAVDISDNGNIVGVVYLNSVETRGFMWKDGSLIDIGDLCPLVNCSTRPFAIDDAERIVGQTTIDMDTVPQERAFVVENGQMFDLNNLLDDPNNVLQDAVLWQAADINDSGQIIAAGNNQRTFLLTAVSGGLSSGGEPLPAPVASDSNVSTDPAVPAPASDSGGGTVSVLDLMFILILIFPAACRGIKAMGDFQGRES